MSPPAEDDLDELLQALATATGPTYSDFLKLDELLGLQPGFEDNSDSLLFFVIHQTKELWLRVMFVETINARDHLFAGHIHHALKTIARVRSIQQVMIESWSALSSLTPVDYLSFRDKLGTSSGFQSPGYRKLEFALGQKDKKYLIPHQRKPHHHQELTEVLEAPSLYDAALHYLDRRGLVIPADLLARDWSEPYEFSEGVFQAWQAVYADTETHFSRHRASMTRRFIISTVADWLFRPICWRATGRSRTNSARVSSRPGRRSMPIRRLISKPIIWPKCWSISNAISNFGVSSISRPSSA